MSIVEEVKQQDNLIVMLGFALLWDLGRYIILFAHTNVRSGAILSGQVPVYYAHKAISHQKGYNLKGGISDCVI